MAGTTPFYGNIDLRSHQALNLILHNIDDIEAIVGVAGQVIYYTGVAPSVTYTKGYYAWDDISNSWYQFSVNNDKTDYGLIGVIDSSNTIFTSQMPFVTNSTKLYRNGVRQFLNSDYIEISSSQISILPAPLPGENLILDYKIII